MVQAHIKVPGNLIFHLTSGECWVCGGILKLLKLPVDAKLMSVGGGYEATGDFEA